MCGCEWVSIVYLKILRRKPFTTISSFTSVSEFFLSKMSKVVFLACLVAFVAVVEGKKWKEARTCLDDKAHECFDKCKSGAKGGIFPVEKFTKCLTKSRAEAVEVMKSCLSEQGFDHDKLQEKECWKPNEDDFKSLHKTSDAPIQLPAAKKLMECAKNCMQGAKEICFEGCDAKNDKKVDEAIKTCAPKTHDAVKPILKQCMRS